MKTFDLSKWRDARALWFALLILAAGLALAAVWNRAEREHPSEWQFDGLLRDEGTWYAVGNWESQPEVPGSQQVT